MRIRCFDIIAVVLPSLLGAHVVAAIPPGIDAREILIQARHAAGGDAWAGLHTLHEVGRIEAGGLSGKYESWIDVTTGRYADRFELGPATFAQGFDGEQAWSADTTGQARVDDAEDAREEAANEAYRRSWSFWIPGRRHAAIEDGGVRSERDRQFRVVRMAPEGGRPFEIWVDASTLRIDRIVESGGTDTTMTLLSDERQVAGTAIAHAIRITNGKLEYDQRIVLTTIEANVRIEPAVFALPPPPPPDFSLAAGKTSTSIPFAMINEHIALDLRINGHGPMRIYCDTGGSNVITPATARQLGVTTSGTLQGKGVGEGSGDVGLAKIDSIEIGDATIHSQVFAVFDFSALEAVDGGSIPGIVGYELFKRFVVRIDYENRRMTLTLPAAFRPEADAIEVPFVFHGSMPQVQGTVDGIPGTFDIDTGSRSSLDLTRPFVEEHDLVKRYAARFESITGWGVGGPVRSSLARAGNLTLGSIRVPGVVALLSRQTSGAFADKGLAGNVGAGILRRFTLTFDYPGKRIFFTKNASFDEPDTYDRAGMWINAAAGAFEVVDVVAGGPAAGAGLRIGDRIVAVDGQPVAGNGLSDFRRRMRSDPPGTTVRLAVAAPGGKPRDVMVVLRDLI